MPQTKNGYNESGITYDKNGNLLTLKRYSAGVMVDNLSYTYENSGVSNRLWGVSDITGNSAGFTDVVGVDYSYDTNGNATKDLNKGITGITYNVLNLPLTVTKDASNSLTYVYSASGEKLALSTKENGVTTTRYYAGGFEYDNAKTLSLLKTAEGIVTRPSGAYVYEYYLKDHLGNTRMSFTPSGQVPVLAQRTDYYPFGLVSGQLLASTGNKYLYNGKELQSALNWNVYDYGARFYDAATARFMAIDPLAGILREITPYGYAYNNPVNFIDKDGNGPKTTATDPNSILSGPKVDMKNAPGWSPRNAAGFQRNGPWFWKQMLIEHPEMFSEKNIIRINRNISPECDAEWIERSPSHATYKGQRLVHHHMDQADMAVGIPEGAHKEFSKELHPYTRGTLRGLGGTLNTLIIGTMIFDLFSDNPHSIGSMVESRKMGKLYFDNDSQNYFDISSRKDNYNKDGKLVSADITVDAYSSYTYDKEQGKYVGVNKVGTSTSTVYYGEDAKKIFIQLQGGL